jgi:protein-S-isoprenylcysteine O-methyltransferase Ste14
MRFIVALKEEFEHTGNWLFRWRSYLPILLLCIFVIGFFDLRLRAEDGGRGLMWELACFAVALLGLAVRIYTAGYAPRGTSGRHTLRQEAKRLNSSGMYSLLRHPLYLGNALMWLGISLFIHVWWVVVISMLIFWIYYERIMFAEEEFLLQQFGHKFEVWAKKTPAFLPKFKNWIPPDKDFSWKKILRYESPTLLLITTSLTFLHALRDQIVLGTIEIDWVWITLLSITLLFYLVIRILRKATRILS